MCYTCEVRPPVGNGECMRCAMYRYRNGKPRPRVEGRLGRSDKGKPRPHLRGRKKDA